MGCVEVCGGIRGGMWRSARRYVEVHRGAWRYTEWYVEVRRGVSLQLIRLCGGVSLQLFKLCGGVSLQLRCVEGCLSN